MEIWDAAFSAVEELLKDFVYIKINNYKNVYREKPEHYIHHVYIDMKYYDPNEFVHICFYSTYLSIVATNLEKMCIYYENPNIFDILTIKIKEWYSRCFNKRREMASRVRRVVNNMDMWEDGVRTV